LGPKLNLLQKLIHLPTELRRRTTAGSTYRPEIDGLRFFAIFMVIIGHMVERIIRFQEPISKPSDFEHSLFFYLAQPASGVFLFFTVSGFIIANQYLRKSPMPFNVAYLKSYFLRRLLRIEPPYFLLLIGTYLLLTITGYVPDGVHRFNAEPANLTTSLVASLFYFHSPVYGTFPRLFGPGWSLEMEVQFYLLAPLFFCVLYFVRNKLERRIIELILLVAGFGLASYFAADNNPPHEPIFWQYSLLHFFIFFWMGVMIASNQEDLKKFLAKVPNLLIQVLPWIGVAAIFLADSIFYKRPDPAYILQILGIFAAFFGVMDDRSSFKTFCSRPWISFIGGACYSIYLVHLQILQVAAGFIVKHLHMNSWMAVLAICSVILVPLVLVCGLGFYAIIERTFMLPDWPQRFFKLFKRQA
jgi:peptidoglycan/LPS O-acetylase OafA/YrhL